MNEELVEIPKGNSKSIIITKDVHDKFKVYCKKNNMKLGGLLENLIELFLDNPKEIIKKIEDLKQ